MALQGGNDSYGTGLSAGGAQVMGQSKGLDELVKYGMAKAKQRMQRPFGVTTPSIDTRLVKASDMPGIIDNVSDFRNHGLNANQATDLATRANEGTLMNNAYAHATVNAAASNEAQAFGQGVYKTVHSDANIPSGVLAKFDNDFHNWEKLKTGESGEAEARQLLDVRKYAAYNPNTTTEMLRKFGVDKQTSELSAYNGGGTLDSIQKTRRADGGAMLNAVRNVIAGNENAKYQYENKGQAFMNDPANARALQGFHDKYGADITNKSDVGASIDVAAEKRNMDLFNERSDKIRFAPKASVVNIGNGQTESQNQGPSNVSINLNGTHEDGREYTTKANLNYDQTYGNNRYTAGIGGDMFDFSQNKLVNKPGLSDVSLVGSLRQNFYAPGAKRPIFVNDKDGNETAVQERDDKGALKFEDAHGGILTAGQEAYFKKFPALAKTALIQKEMVHARSKEFGLSHDYLIDRAKVPNSAFPSTKKGWQGQADGAARATNQEAVKKNNAKSLPEIKI